MQCFQHIKILVQNCMWCDISSWQASKGSQRPSTYGINGIWPSACCSNPATYWEDGGWHLLHLHSQRNIILCSTLYVGRRMYDNEVCWYGGYGDVDVVNMDGCEWRIITCNSEMETTPANTSSRQITNGGHPPPSCKTKTLIREF